MIKVFSPSGWSWDQPIAQMVKVSSRGLIGSDRSDFIKLAGSTAPAFLNAIDSVKFAKDEVPVHLLAMGSTEMWGANRNGDGWTANTLRDYHDTFEKFARWYRNHQNKNPALSYGVVKKSAFNAPMSRVELLVALNAEKSAAERNGGFIADRELEKLAKDQDLAVSMACRVPYDVCSGCGHKARTRDEYCTGSTCKYGGCRDNLTKIADDGFMLYVDNPTPSFFDISDVWRPADRTAYGTKADWLQKAASDEGYAIGGAKMAELLDVTAPLAVCLSQDEPWTWSTTIRGQVKLAAGLAAAEKHFDRSANQSSLKAFHSSVQPQLNEAQLSLLGAPGSEKAAQALGALADRKVVLTLNDFARWTGRDDLAKVAADHLPRVFNRLTSRNDLHDRVMHNRYGCSEKTASVAQRTLAHNLENTHSLAAFPVRDRAMRCELRGLDAPAYKTAFVTEKSASDVPGAADLAEEYGLYKLAALHRMAATDSEFHLTASLAIGQNKVM